MQERLEIRAAEAADLDDLLDLYQHLTEGDARPSGREAAKRLAQLQALPGSDVLIGCVQGRMLTSCTLVVIPNLTRGGKPYGLIENVVTHAEARGRGHGKAILAAAVEQAWRHDCYKVMLLTGSAQPSTHAFYRAAGFEQSKTGFQVWRIAKRAEAGPTVGFEEK